MNWVDYLIIGLIAFSCIVGLMRGLLREVIALVTWVAALWLAWNYADLVEPRLGGALAEPAVRAWAARGLIFLIVLLAGTLIGVGVGHFVRLSLFSGLDRFLGGLFGLLRGAIVIGLFVMLCHALRLTDESWWRGSVLAPSAEHAANVLRAMVGERKIESDHSTRATL